MHAGPRRAARTTAATLALGLAASPAAASESGNDAEDRITRYDVAIELAADGAADVVLDLEVDFGTRPNHGPYLTYLVKQRYDDTQDRVYRLTDVRAESPSAPDDVDVEEDGALLVVRVGDEDEEITGVHSYRITYRAEGWVNSSSATGDDDELYLNVLGGWEVPVEDARVTVTGPADVTAVECYAGADGARDACDAAAAEGPRATFAQAGTPRGGALTVVAAYPAGTFGGVEPLLQDRWAAGRAFALTPATGVATLALLLGGGAVVGRRARLRGRDEQFLGLTPGLQPAPGQDAAVGPRGRTPVAVQFAPPAGFRPGQLGTLVDEHADPHDVTATVVDLAVRGHLRIEEVVQDDDGARERRPGRARAEEWRLVRTRADATDLLPFERLLLDELFAGRDVVGLSDLRTTFAAATGRVQAALHDDVTARGWFRGDPSAVRTRWALAGVGLLLLGVVATVLLAIWTSWALVGLAVVAIGVLMTSLTRSAPARTALGSAVLAQAEGFRRYLATAEADRLRFEEGEDLFSRYLPYAVAFGLTERWARVFAAAAAQGRTLPEPAWYVGPYAHAGPWSDDGFAGRLASFTDVAQAALTAPTPGSSGSPGGGGFAGGGVSGGGGGTW